MTKVVSAYIVYELDTWPRNLTNSFKFKNCLFGATNIVRNSDTEKCVYSGYGITFNIAGSWSFDSDIARNFIISGVNNSSSCHSDSRKNKFLISDEGPNSGINRSFGSPEKNVRITFTKANSKFCLSLHYNAYNSYLFVNEKKN